LPAEERAVTRSDYPHQSTLQTRWADNDVYGHVNNVEYYAFFDTVINRWLIAEGGLDIHEGEVIGVCAESHCTYLGALTFPDDVDAGLRVGKLGTSSVRYEIGLFAPGSEEPSATGWFVHVFVDARTRRPAPMPEQLRACLERLALDGDGGEP
jgi:acyl-CoA thioester hydrolase